MLLIVALLSRRARTMPRRSPFTSVTPALSIAMSVPVPIAIPTSAAANRRRVVDAVSSHCDPLAALLQPLDDGGFLIRQHVGFNLIDQRIERRLPQSCDCRRST